MTKVVLVGTGAVGMSFIYAMINQGIQAEYVLIDVFTNVAEGNVRDIQDSICVLSRNGSKVKLGDYADCSDASVVVITAGRPQKSATESRLDMVSDNAKIITEIGQNIKKSNFSGVTIIASNPCDILAAIYQKSTGFDEKKVLSSGTLLDTTRMKRFLGAKLKVNAESINGYILGEHGDNSVPAFSLTTIGCLPLTKFIEAKKISEEDLDKIHKQVINEAYEIIRLKRVTCYGIGACLATIAAAVINDTGCIYPVGIKLDRSFENSGIYLGYPAKIGCQGWSKVGNIKLSEREETMFNQSSKNIAEIYHHVLKATKTKK